MKKQFFALMGIILSLHAADVSFTRAAATRATIIPAPSHILTVEVSAGELFDKLTILRIKSKRIKDTQKLNNIKNELAAIDQTIIQNFEHTRALDDLITQLQLVNEKLWDIENAIREKEVRQEFDAEFIELARAVYFTNDKRGSIKRRINILLGSHLMEEKQYTNYEQK